MIITIVRFRSGLPEGEVLRVSEERAPRYREVEGLVQKYYLRYPETGEYGAVYVWNSEEDLQAFRDSDLVRTIPDVYRIEGELGLERADVVLELRSK